MTAEEIDALRAKCKHLREFIAQGLPISSAVVDIVLESTIWLADAYERSALGGNEK